MLELDAVYNVVGERALRVKRIAFFIDVGGRQGFAILWVLVDGKRGKACRLGGGVVHGSHSGWPLLVAGTTVREADAKAGSVLAGGQVFLY